METILNTILTPLPAWLARPVTSMRNMPTPLRPLLMAKPLSGPLAGSRIGSNQGS